MATILPAIVGAVVSKATDYVSSLFGSNSSSAKKQASLANQAVVNSGHAGNYYNAIINQTDPDNGRYFSQGFLDNSDIPALTSIFNSAIEKINANPEFGVGQAYTSKYTGFTYNTAPSSAIAPMVDDYISQKKSGQPAETMDFDTIFKNLFTEVAQVSAAQAAGAQAAWPQAAAAQAAGAQANYTPFIIGGAVLLLIFVLKR